MKTINIIFPVYNEERRIADGINRTMEFMTANSIMPFQLNVVDNGSIDRTQEIAESLCAKYPEVHYTRITEKGTGIAVKTGILNNTSDYVGYMDIDLSTNIRHILQVQEMFLADPSLEYINGSRFSRESEVSGRKWYRNISSYGLIFLLKTVLHMKSSDSICGFSFWKKDCAESLVSECSEGENGWFYLIEMLLRAERKGCRIYEMPVEWEDDPRTTVRYFAVIRNYLKNIVRLQKVFRNS